MISTSRSYSTSVPGPSSTHHRRTSSKVQSSSPSSNVTHMNDDGGASKEKRDKAAGAGAGYTFPPAGNEGYGVARGSPGLSSIYEDGVLPSGKERNGSREGTPTSMRISPVRHRLSPSLPYPPYSGPSSNGPTSSRTPSLVRLLYLNLRRARWLDLAYGIVFVASLLVFLSALAGVGHIPPPTPSPTLISTPLPSVRPIYAAAPPPPLLLPELVIKDEAEPVYARGRPRAEDLHPPRREGEGDKEMEHHDVARPDLLKDSPDDPHLDEEHEHHYHHPPEGNLFRAVGEGEDHQHEHGQERHGGVEEVVRGDAVDEETEEDGELGLCPLMSSH